MSGSYTFGVELELIICGLPSGEPDPSPPDGRKVRFPINEVPNAEELLAADFIDGTEMESVSFSGACAQAIADVLIRANIPAIPWFRDGSLRLGIKASDWGLSGLKIDTDPIISVDDFEHTPFWDSEEYNPYQHFSMEIISPVLQSGNSGNPMMDEVGFDEVARVTGIIQREFRVFTNKTTGLHIHVGNGLAAGQFFPIGTIAKLMAFLWTFGKGIEKLHPHVRRDHTRNFYCKPLRKNLHRDLLGRSGRAVVDGILSCTTIPQLGELFLGWQPDKTSKFAGYNMSNLAHNSVHDTKRTIEFRQHEGSCDAATIQRWAMFCVHVVDYCARNSVEGIRNLCHQAMAVQELRCTDYTFIGEVCRRIGFTEGEMAWATIREGAQPKEDEAAGVGGSFDLPANFMDQWE